MRQSIRILIHNKMLFFDFTINILSHLARLKKDSNNEKLEKKNVDNN